MKGGERHRERESKGCDLDRAEENSGKSRHMFGRECLNKNGLIMA